MLTCEDFALYFQAIPRDFDLKFNGNSVKCNKSCVCGFSKRVRSEVEKDPSIESLSFEVDVPMDVAENVIEFLHGGELKVTSELVFEFFYFAAFMGIEVVSRRVVFDVCDSFTEANFEERFKLLSAFTEFCRPIVVFLDKNPTLFRRLIHDNVLSCDVLTTLVEGGRDIFKSEDERFDFVRTVATEGNNLALYRTVKSQILSHEKRAELLALPVDVQRNCRYFGLISAMMSERDKMANEITALKNQIGHARTELTNLQNTPSADETAEEVKNRARQRALQIADRLHTIAACAELLAVKSQPTEVLMSTVRSMIKQTEVLMQILHRFYEKGGWLLFPGTSVNSVELGNEWHKYLSHMEEIVMRFDPPVSEAGRIANDFLSNAEGLKELCLAL